MQERFRLITGAQVACIATALLVGVFAAPAVAQAPSPNVAPAANGTIVGAVLDQEKHPIAGAIVQVQGPQTATTTTAKDGTFTLDHLLLGSYTLTITHAGFKNVSEDGLAVTAAAGQPVIVSLTPADLSSLREIARISSNRKLSLNDSSASVSSLSGSDYVAQAQPQIKNLLDELPGVELNQYSSGAPGANATVSIRGAASYETQNLIDGHPVSTGTDGDYLVNFLNSLVYDGVDVFKGPGFLGNTIGNAVGGTINFRTPPITATPTARFIVGYDTFNGSYYSLRASDTLFGKLGLLVDVARFGTPGFESNQSVPYVYNTLGTPNYTYVPLGVVSDTLHLGQTFDNKAQVFKVSYNFTPSISLTLGSNSSQTYVDYTGTLANYNPITVSPCIDFNPPMGAPSNCTGADNPPGAPSYTNPKYAGLAGQTINGFYGYNNDFETNNEPIFTGDFRAGIGQGTLLARYYTGSIYRTVDGIGEAGTITSCNDPACSLANASIQTPYLQNQHDLLHGADAELDYPLGASILTAGFDRHTDITTSCSGNPDPMATSGQYSCLPQNGGINGTTVQSITYSLRGQIQATDRARIEIGNYLTSTSYAGSRYDPRLGFAYRLSSNAIVRGSAGSSYVLPYAGILNTSAYVNQGTLNAVSNVKPETSISYDVGSDYAFGRYGKISADVYYTNIYNRFDSITIPQMGTYNGTAYKFLTYQFNLANSRDQGIELELDEAPPVGFGFRGTVDLARNYAFNINPSTVGNAAGPYSYLDNGAQLPGHPYSKERLEASYTLHDGLAVRFGSWTYGAWNAFGEPGFTLFDGGVSFPLYLDARLSFNGYNLFNHDDNRVFTEYNYGYNPVQSGGGLFPVSLLFARPRTFTVQLSKSVGP